MSVFYQQSGKRGEVDFRKTISTAEGGLRFFTAAQLKNDYGYDLAPGALQSMSAGAGFQVWGVPSGARRVVSALKNGDIVLLIGELSRNDLDFARFFYAGRVIHIASEEEFTFSSALWGDGGFPLIFFMQGALIDYTWRDFTDDFQMAQNYYVAGQTMRVSSERLAASRYESTEGFALRLGISAAQLRITHHPLAEQLAFEEGDKSLKTHLAVERSRRCGRNFAS